jgi:hypothetical protein
VKMDSPDLYYPEVLMSSSEKREARKHLRALERLQWRDAAPALGSKEYDRFREKLEMIHEALGRIAAAVLERETGLERYMVVDVWRSDSYQKRLQILSFGLMDHFAQTEWAWELSGRSLRKNGTLGKKGESTAFNVARIMRRKLDGTWERVSPRQDDESRP